MVKMRPSGNPRGFARMYIRLAQRDHWLTDSRPKGWLLIEWPKGENEPNKCWLPTPV
jgi:hypothetical protein